MFIVSHVEQYSLIPVSVLVLVSRRRRRRRQGLKPKPVVKLTISVYAMFLAFSINFIK